MTFLSALTDAARTRWARIEAALRAHPLLWALVLSTVIAALFVLTLSPGYQTNDDVAMQSAVDGTMGEPSPHLVFSNVLIGLLLSTLYRAVGWFPWYGLYLYAAHFAALLAVVYVVLADRRGHLQVRLFALGGVLAVFHLSMWMELQFTSTAILFGVSGVMLYLAVAPREPARWGTIAVGGAMVGLSSWIRWHSGWAVVLLSVPVLALTLRRLPWRRLALFAGTAAAVLLGGSVAQAIYYAGQPGWQTYFELNSARDHIQQSPLLDQLDPAILAEVGWSQNDLRMFENWFFTDPKVHEAGDIETIAAALPTSFQLRSALAALADQGRGWLGALRLAVIASLAGLTWVEGGRRGRALVLVGAAALVVIAFGLAGAAKLPVRVAAPMLAFLPLLFLATPQTDANGPSAGLRPAVRVWRRLTAVVAAAALVVGMANALALDRRHHSADAGLREVLSGLKAIDPAGLFVSWGARGARLPLGGQSLSPWRREGLGGPQLLGLGWQERSPMHEAMMADHGIDDLYAAIANRADVYLPLRNTPSVIPYRRYLREHYGFSGLPRPVARAGPYTVYNLVVAFEVDDQAGTLIERRLDGSSVTYPLGSPGNAGQATALHRDGGPVLIAGRADGDLVVVTSRGEAIVLVLPAGKGAFSVTLARSRTDLRLFALSAGRATEVTLGSVSLP